MSSRGQVGEPEGIGRIVRPVLMSVAVGAAACVGILLLLSFILTTQSVPQSMIGPMSIFAISVSSLVSGFCCAKFTRRSGLAYGAACGATLTMVVLLASLAVSDGGFGVPAVFKAVFMLISAMLGGVFGVNTGKRRRK